MVGRALLGVAIGGFWSMSTAIVMRLFQTDMVPKALAMLNAGNAIAATIAAPLGSFLGAYHRLARRILPRGSARPAGACVAVDQPARASAAEQKTGGNVLLLLGRRPVALGMASILFLFMGQFALFTYLRPFLENVTRFDIPALS